MDRGPVPAAPPAPLLDSTLPPPGAKLPERQPEPVLSVPETPAWAAEADFEAESEPIPSLEFPDLEPDRPSPQGKYAAPTVTRQAAGDADRAFTETGPTVGPEVTPEPSLLIERFGSAADSEIPTIIEPAEEEAPEETFTIEADETEFSPEDFESEPGAAEAVFTSAASEPQEAIPPVFPAGTLEAPPVIQPPPVARPHAYEPASYVAEPLPKEEKTSPVIKVPPTEEEPPELEVEMDEDGLSSAPTPTLRAEPVWIAEPVPEPEPPRVPEPEYQKEPVLEPEPGEAPSVGAPPPAWDIFLEDGLFLSRSRAGLVMDIDGNVLASRGDLSANAVQTVAARLLPVLDAAGPDASHTTLKLGRFFATAVRLPGAQYIAGFVGEEPIKPEVVPALQREFEGY
jgi:hypothetical protein